MALRHVVCHATDTNAVIARRICRAVCRRICPANIPTANCMLNAVCYQFVGNVCHYGGNVSWLANSFAKLVRGVGLTFDELYTMYIVKNALNKLRQVRGYTAGTYKKDWNGVEDNVVAMQIGKGLTFDVCYAKLEEYYDTHIAS